MDSKTARIEYYDTEISALDASYKTNVKLAKVEKPDLLSITNPEYEKLKRKYNHLQNVVIDDSDTKNQLPIHLVLGNLLSVATASQWQKKQNLVGLS